FFFSSRRRHTRSYGDWSSDVLFRSPDHGQRNGALLNEIHLAIKDILRIIIESHDETGHNFHAVVLDAPNAFQKTAMSILHLLCLDRKSEVKGKSISIYQ